jgi:hypothetical protein
MELIMDLDGERVIAFRRDRNKREAGALMLRTVAVEGH